MRKHHSWIARSAAALLLLSVAVLGCSGITGPAGQLDLVTNGERFALEDTALEGVPFTVVNRGWRTVYLARCGAAIAVEADRLEGTRWARYGGGVCLASLPLSPLAVRPGERYEGALSIHEKGSFRLRVGASAGPSSAPDWRAVSNSFSIE